MGISLIILLLLVFIPPIADFLSLHNLSMSEWLIVILLSLVPLVIVEIYKLIKKIAKK